MENTLRCVVTIDNLSPARQIKITVSIIIINFFSHLSITPSLSLSRSMCVCVCVRVEWSSSFSRLSYMRDFSVAFFFSFSLNVYCCCWCSVCFKSPPVQCIKLETVDEIKSEIDANNGTGKTVGTVLYINATTWEPYRSWGGIEHACVCNIGARTPEHTHTTLDFFFFFFRLVYAHLQFSYVQRWFK